MKIYFRDAIRMYRIGSVTKEEHEGVLKRYEHEWVKYKDSADIGYADVYVYTNKEKLLIEIAFAGRLAGWTLRMGKTIKQKSLERL